jgi:hypothetical protein
MPTTAQKAPMGKTQNKTNANTPDVLDGMIKLSLVKQLEPATDVFQLAKAGQSICGGSFLPAPAMNREPHGRYDEMIFTYATVKEIVSLPSLRQ